MHLGTWANARYVNGKIDGLELNMDSGGGKVNEHTSAAEGQNGNLAAGINHTWEVGYLHWTPRTIHRSPGSPPTLGTQGPSPHRSPTG